MKPTSANITVSSGKSVEAKGITGLFDCLLEHEVKATRAKFDWTGPKINPDKWKEVLAFFRWTQVTEKSEAQVRLFVHPQHGWMAWAFPQKGGTWMTTNEIENEESRRQRAQDIPEGYVAFGTVHHHCNSTAFQSGTDETDEKNVDGLHITVGNLEDKVHTIHCRLYIKGHRFEPNMAAYWDIGVEAENFVKQLGELGFEVEPAMDKLARKAMCVAVDDTVEFNPKWKENYIVNRPVVTTGKVIGFNGTLYGHDKKMSRGVSKHEIESEEEYYARIYGHHEGQTIGEVTDAAREKMSVEENSKAVDKVKKLLTELEFDAGTMNLSPEEFVAAIEELGDPSTTDFYQEVAAQCVGKGIKFEDLWLVLEEDILRDEEHADKAKAEQEGFNLK